MSEPIPEAFRAEPDKPAKEPLTEQQIQALLDMAAMQSAASAPHRPPYKMLAIVCIFVVLLVLVAYVIVAYLKSK
jgi:hypothetical protein